MKVKLIDENNIIVFLNQFKSRNIDFNSKNNLEKELKTLFKCLNINYGIKIYGYYNVYIYVDKYYGVVIDICKEDIDYISYDETSVDMRIVITNKEFLYQLNDIFNINIPSQLYKYKNKYYLRLINNITDIDMGKLLEYAEIVYDDNIEDILRYGNILKNIDYVI